MNILDVISQIHQMDAEVRVATKEYSYTLTEDNDTIILEDGFKIYDIFIPYKDIIYVSAIGIIGIDTDYYQPVYGEKQIYLPISETFKFRPIL